MSRYQEMLALINGKYMLEDGRWYDPGFDFHELKNIIRREMRDEGWDDQDIGFIFEVEKRYEKFFVRSAHVTWGQAQKLGLIMSSYHPSAKRALEDEDLTFEEIEYILQKLQGANPPVADSIRAKLNKKLK